MQMNNSFIRINDGGGNIHNFSLRLVYIILLFSLHSWNYGVLFFFSLNCWIKSQFNTKIIYFLLFCFCERKKNYYYLHHVCNMYSVLLLLLLSFKRRKRRGEKKNKQSNNLNSNNLNSKKMKTFFFFIRSSLCHLMSLHILNIIFYKLAQIITKMIYVTCFCMTLFRLAVAEE